MGILHYAINSTKKQYFELGKINLLEEELVGKNLEEITNSVWSVIDPSRNFTVGFTQDYAKFVATLLYEMTVEWVYSDCSNDTKDFSEEEFTKIGSIYQYENSLAVLERFNLR